MCDRIDRATMSTNPRLPWNHATCCLRHTRSPTLRNKRPKPSFTDIIPRRAPYMMPHHTFVSSRLLMFLLVHSAPDDAVHTTQPPSRLHHISRRKSIPRRRSAKSRTDDLTALTAFSIAQPSSTRVSTTAKAVLNNTQPHSQFGSRRATAVTFLNAVTPMRLLSRLRHFTSFTHHRPAAEWLFTVASHLGRHDDQNDSSRGSKDLSYQHMAHEGPAHHAARRNSAGIHINGCYTWTSTSSSRSSPAATAVIPVLVSRLQSFSPIPIRKRRLHTSTTTTLGSRAWP